MKKHKDVLEAERLIRQAIKTGADHLNLSDLTGVTSLSDFDVNIADAISLETLDLRNTQITDLSPIAGLNGITMLELGNTQITDFSPLSGLQALRHLYLENTAFSDLHMLPRAAKFQQLDLKGSNVTDLRPLRDLTFKGKFGKFTFRVTNTPAARSDPKIAEIDAMEDHEERVKALLAYVATLPSDGDGNDDIKLPDRRPAPLKAEIFKNRLTLSLPTALPEADANDRAQMGWEALKDFRDSFGQNFALDNYAPLPSVLSAFDRAMGDGFDTRRQIAMGMHGNRIIQLSTDEHFIENLPTGAVSELQSFAAAIGTFVNRFPDWVAYQKDADDASPIAQDIREEKDALEGFAVALAANPQVDDPVAAEYSAEVADATIPSSDEITAHGTMASTRETLLEISEHALTSIKNGDATRTHAKEMAKTGSSEIAKVQFWTYGWSLHLLYNATPSLRKLAKRFPQELKWLDRVLDKVRMNEEDE